MKLSTRLLIAELIEFPLIAVILFIAAGTINWPAGWIFMIVFTTFSVAVGAWLLRHSPGVLEERMSIFRPNQKSWDKVFLVIITVLFIVWLVLMPLDAIRFRWSHVPVWLNIVGLIFLLGSFYVFFLTYRENPYLSATVRIQEERGQTVISTGPYRYVRHPMYAGGFLLFIGAPLLLGSWYGLIVGLIFIVVIVIRATLEERMLREELKGYDAYMSRVEYRFIPHVL